MYATNIPQIENHNGQFTSMRMHLQPLPPFPINYATAAVPTLAPFGTEYTPEQTIKIVGGRRIPVLRSVAYIPNIVPGKPDPAIAPTKPIQHVNIVDRSQWSPVPKTRFDTTYRTEYINRLRNQEQQYTKPTRQFKNSLNQYSVLPPISGNDNRTSQSDRKSVSDNQQPYVDQEVPTNDTMSGLNYNSNNNFDTYEQQQPMPNNEDTYLPEEPVLLTDFEEGRLSEHVRLQLGDAGVVDRMKLFYQELAAYDPNGTGYVHYSHIQSLTFQLGLPLAEDTLRFAMCKFVSPDQPRGFVNYEDLTRYFGKCLSSVSTNQYGSRQYQSGRYWSLHSIYHHTGERSQQQPEERRSPQKSVRPAGGLLSDADDKFDPDERQIRVLLKQNLKNFDLNGTIDFDKLTRELSAADRNQSGILNRQQIDEVVYRVRLPLQRSLIYQILEKHCRAHARLYNWKSFVKYLQEQIFDLKQIQDRSSPIYSQYVPSRVQWLENLQREFHERDRLRVIDRFVANNEGVRVESTHPTAWFTRYLRLANAMYTHRTNSNVSQEFLLPREEARRLFRAYNHVWDLKIDENRVQQVFDACARNGRVVIDDALKQLAK